MRGRRRTSQLRVTGHDRLVDSPVLLAGLIQRVVRRTAMPQAHAHRSGRQAGQQRRQHGVAGGPGDDRVKGDVRLDQFLHCAGHAHALEALPEVVFLRRVDASGGQRRGRGLEDAPHLVELDLGLAEQQVADETGALQEQGRLEAADIRAVALTHLQHAQLRQRAHRFAEGVARQTELGGQLGLLRQPVARAPRARDDVLPDLVDGLLGDARGPAYPAAGSRAGGAVQRVTIVAEAVAAAKRSDVQGLKPSRRRSGEAGRLTNIGALAYNSTAKVGTHILRASAHDIRFPTSRNLDGSDAMNRDPDYSAAYVVLETDHPAGIEGHGLTFTIGRGNELCVEAIELLAPHVVGRTLEDIAGDMSGFWRDLVADSQLRWLGPEKGVVHLATAALVNAVWDLYAKVEKKPLWKLLADMSPEKLVACIDFRYIDDVLSPAEATAMLRRWFDVRA